MSKTFDDFEEGLDNLMIVDGLNLAFRYKHANKKEFVEEYISTVQSLAMSYNARDIVVLGDGGSSYRKGIDPEYKANREELKKAQTPQEAEEFQEFLIEFSNTLEVLSNSYYTFRFKGVEADDIAAYLARTYIDNYTHVWLISSDKDWDLMISDKVSRFSYRTRKETTLANWGSHYDYEVEDHISIKVLMGDKGDNVPGVEGIGEKRAYNVLREFGPTAYDVYCNIPIDRPQKFIQNLNAFKDKLLTNYELMDLPSFCEAAIGKDNIDIINGEMK